ncbi:MAG: 4a-hydroxytetrahydrobiopterin dehydratase [Adhaeribacter sp.]
MANEMWLEENNRLRRSFQFRDFKEAFAFMTQVALTAEQMNHHPQWTNTYNRVEMELFTFDAGNTVTVRDHRLAAAIDAIAGRYLP